MYKKGLIILLGFISMSVSMEKEENSVVSGASYCSIEFPDKRKVRVFYSVGSLTVACEKPIAELLQRELVLIIRLKNKKRKTLNKFSKTVHGKEDLGGLKKEIASLLDSEAEIPEGLSSLEELHKNAVIHKGCALS